MIKHSSQPPFCLAEWQPVISNDILVPIDAYHAYDAVMIYAQALTESLRDGYDPRNGTNVVERIRNRRYRSVLGFDVSKISIGAPYFRFLTLNTFFSSR